MPLPRRPFLCTERGRRRGGKERYLRLQSANVMHPGNGPPETREAFENSRHDLEVELSQAVKMGESQTIMALVSRGANIALETDLGYGIPGNLVDLAAWR